MTWADHVARMGERRGVYRIFVGKSEGKSHLEDPDVDGRIILRWIYRSPENFQWVFSNFFFDDQGAGLLHQPATWRTR